MKPLRFFGGSVLLIMILGLSLSGCDQVPPLGAKPKITIEYQETTATVTATWSRPANAPPSWNVYYEWTNERISGGNACSHAEATTMTSVSFTCSRSEATPGVMKFEVWAVRNVDGSLYPGPRRAEQYEVAPTGIVVPGEVDSLTINVTDASGLHRRLADESRVGVDIKYTVPEGSTDTTWRYSAHLADGTVLENLVVQTGLDHTGIQLTALVWLNGEVVACSGDCVMYPATMRYNHPWGAPTFQAFAERTLAYNPFPPAVDVLGR